MNALRVGAAALLALGALVCARPATAQTTVVAPSPAQRCLTRGGPTLGTPAYPQEAFAVKVGARVVVDLEFASPTAAPLVRKIDAGDTDSRFARAFTDEVRRFIGDYRVPCLPANETTSLRQEFAFLPQDGRPVSMLSSMSEQERRAGRMSGCMRHAQPGTKPDYPMNDLRREQQGTVVLRAEFADGDSAPKLTVLDDGGSGALADSAREFAEGFRLPCHDKAGAVDFVQLYIFKIEGGARVVLKDTPLLSLLGNVKGIRSANVYFDLNTMGCPFDVRFTPMQPHAPNRVGEIGDTNVERRFFLDWLTRLQIDLPQRQLNAVTGQDAVVSVPCTILRLGSTTGGSASQ
jgi:hypothetical protein